MPYLIPIRLRKTDKCPRCTKRFKRGLMQCPHCSDITSDAELQRYIAQHQAEMRGGVTIGIYFMCASVFVLLLMALLQ